MQGINTCHSYNEVDLPALEILSYTSLKCSLTFKLKCILMFLKNVKNRIKILAKGQISHVRQRTKQKASYPTPIERPFKVSQVYLSAGLFFSLKDLNIKIQITVLKATLSKNESACQ